MILALRCQRSPRRRPRGVSAGRTARPTTPHCSPIQAVTVLSLPRTILLAPAHRGRAPASGRGRGAARSRVAAGRDVRWPAGRRSRVNVLAGARLFPGRHHHARFEVDERNGRYRVALHSDDGQTSVRVAARAAHAFPTSSVFASLAEASEFFARGSLGYSTGRRGELEGLELLCARWEVEPLIVERARSSFFEDPSRFPAGSAELDCALLMRDVRHEWHGRTVRPDALASR